MRYLIVLLLVIFSQTAISADEFKEFFPVQYHSAEIALQLTKAEQQWLKRHNNIRIAFDGSLPPYSFINDQQKIDGLAFEILTILSQRLGFSFSIHTDSDWSELYRSAARRKVDMVATMVNRPDRAEWFVFTKPYLTKSLVIVTKQDDTAIKSRTDLSNKKIAVAQGYQYGEQLGHEFPNSIRVEVKSMLATLIEVDKGEVDAAILFLGTANYLQAQHHLNTLKIAGFYDRKSADESIAVRKDWPMLAEILQKGLNSLTEEDVQKIFTKWVVQSGENPISQETIKKPGQKATQSVVKKVIATDKMPEISINRKAEVDSSNALNSNREYAGFFLAILAAIFLFFRYALDQKKQQSGIVSAIKISEPIHTDVPNLTIDSAIEVRKAEPFDEAPLEQPILVNNDPVKNEANSDLSSDVPVQYQRDAEGRFIFVSPVSQDTPEQSWTNKRKSTRYVRNDIGIAVRKTGLINFSFLKKVETPVKLSDISSRGVGVVVASNLRLPIKKKINLFIRFADFKEFLIPSTIVRKSPGGVPVYGIKFDRVHNELANYLLETQTTLTFK